MRCGYPVALTGSAEKENHRATELIYTNQEFVITLKGEPMGRKKDRHHIIPRSRKGTNNKWNLATVYKREHLLAVNQCSFTEQGLRG